MSLVSSDRPVPAARRRFLRQCRTADLATAGRDLLAALAPTDAVGAWALLCRADLDARRQTWVARTLGRHLTVDAVVAVLARVPSHPIRDLFLYAFVVGAADRIAGGPSPWSSGTFLIGLAPRAPNVVPCVAAMLARQVPAGFLQDLALLERAGLGAVVTASLPWLLDHPRAEVRAATLLTLGRPTPPPAAPPAVRPPGRTP